MNLNMIKENLDELRNEMDKWLAYSRIEAYNVCINKRLAATLKNYSAKIDEASEYLLRQESFRVLKALTKIQKNKDKEVINDNLIDDESAKEN